MNIRPQRGEVWLANFDPTHGHEIAKSRPCVILSINRFNNGYSNLVIAVPLTSKERHQPSHICIVPPEGGLSVPSYILCEQIRALSLNRFSKKALGKVSENTLRAIELVVTTLMGFKSNGRL